MIDAQVDKQIRGLGIWQGEIAIEPLSGGLTNVNYLVSDTGSNLDADKGTGTNAAVAAQYVVRLGRDIVEHQVMRFNEHAASRAAHAAGLSPRVVHTQDGLLVLDYIACKAYTPDDIRQQEKLHRILPLIKSCHRDIPAHFRGAALVFWVFHVIRDYAWTLREGGSTHIPALAGLAQKAARLEASSGPIDLVFGHNDLVAANILDDGNRLWLIDWDYAGFNSPLFDLGGLVSNNQLSQRQEVWLLENYYETPLSDELFGRYLAMKCASLLRETMWSMVSQLHSVIDHDFAAYTAENLARFERAYDDIT